MVTVATTSAPDTASDRTEYAVIGMSSSVKALISSTHFLVFSADLPHTLICNIQPRHHGNLLMNRRQHIMLLHREAIEKHGLD